MAYTSFKDLTFSKKLEHIWFYYKWYIVAALFLGFAAAICIVQLVQRPNYDATVLWAQTGNVSAQAVEKVADEMEKYCPDFNGDGEVNVDVRFVGLAASTLASPSSEETVSSDSSDTSSTVSQFVNNELELTYKMQLVAEMTSGDSFIYIFDDAVYNTLSGLNGYRDLSNDFDSELVKGDRMSITGSCLTYLSEISNVELYLTVCGPNATKARDTETYAEVMDFVAHIVNATPAN